MKKKLLSSLLSLVLCFTLVVGSTYALFTSESKVNIAVSSGTVNVVASVKDVELYSMGVKQTDKFENGGTATVNGGDLALNGVTAGDKAIVTIAMENKSDVTINYHIETEIVGDLKPMLDVKKIVDENGADKYVALESKTSWAKLSAGQSIDDLRISIELPVENEDANGIETTTNISIKVIAQQGNAPITSTWDGKSVDTSWFTNAPDGTIEFEIESAAALAGLADLVDSGAIEAKVGTYTQTANIDGDDRLPTVDDLIFKLTTDVDLYAEDENGEPICFEPIGSYRQDKAFKGTFDGNGNTISNMSQNTWALDNGYYYGDLGLGLFGLVEDATIKNLNMDGASISGESAICGIVAATAYGDCTFENITVSNSKGADYQYYAGGIVGWASGNHQYINCNIKASTVIGSQWGDFGNCSGGVIGGCGSSATIYLKDCTIACVIDAVNDVVSAYQWYAYRNCGMIIGNTGKAADDSVLSSKVGTTTAIAPQLTCENVTVIYGDWANYTYCEFAGTGYPYVRVQAGTSVDAYSNVRYGHPTDANGNKVVDDNHVHNDGEDHHLLIAFDQLYGGKADQRYCVYGTATHPGVNVVYNNK